MQRLLDAVLAFLALAALSPALAAVCIVLRFTGEGEIFFLQKRIGLHGRPFFVYKFATMQKDSPNVGTGTITLQNDPRILPLGKILRKTKINELPQLANVLFGDMSLIGPRPLTPRCFDAFPQRLKSTITSVRPGLSGVGSIVFRNEEDILNKDGNSPDFYDNVIMPYKAELEAWYVDNASTSLYTMLLITTIAVVLNPRSTLPSKVLRDAPKPNIALSHALQHSPPQVTNRPPAEM